jgi:hypothetical protein
VAWRVHTALVDDDTVEAGAARTWHGDLQDVVVESLEMPQRRRGPERRLRAGPHEAGREEMLVPGLWDSCDAVHAASDTFEPTSTEQEPHVCR